MPILSPGSSFDFQLFLVDEDGLPYNQSPPYPKISLRRVSGTPTDIFIDQTMTPDTLGTFYYSFTPTTVGQYHLKYEYQLFGSSKFFFDDVDVETGGSGGGGSNISSSEIIIVAEPSDDDVIIVDESDSVIITDSNMEAVVIAKEC